MGLCFSGIQAQARYTSKQDKRRSVVPLETI